MNNNKEMTRIDNGIWLHDGKIYTSLWFYRGEFDMPKVSYAENEKHGDLIEVNAKCILIPNEKLGGNARAWPLRVIQDSFISSL